MVEHLDQIHWTDDAPNEVRNRVRRKVRRQRIAVRAVDDYIRLSGTVIFKNALFKTDIRVATGETAIKDPELGMMEHFTRGQLKLLNEELLIEDLPVVIEDPPGPFG